MLSIAGVSLVAFYSTANNCHDHTHTHNETNGTNGSGGYYFDDTSHVLTHISHGGDPCSEKSTALGYIVRSVCACVRNVFVMMHESLVQVYKLYV